MIPLWWIESLPHSSSFFFFSFVFVIDHRDSGHYWWKRQSESPAKNIDLRRLLSFLVGHSVEHSSFPFFPTLRCALANRKSLRLSVINRRDSYFFSWFCQSGVLCHEFTVVHIFVLFMICRCWRPQLLSKTWIRARGTVHGKIIRTSRWVWARLLRLSESWYFMNPFCRIRSFSNMDDFHTLWRASSVIRANDRSFFHIVSHFVSDGNPIVS